MNFLNGHKLNTIYWILIEFLLLVMNFCRMFITYKGISVSMYILYIRMYIMYKYLHAASKHIVCDIWHHSCHWVYVNPPPAHAEGLTYMYLNLRLTSAFFIFGTLCLMLKYNMVMLKYMKVYLDLLHGVVTVIGIWESDNHWASENISCIILAQKVNYSV